MTLTAKDVAEITRLLEESSFDELYLELDGVKLSLRRGGAAPPAAADPGSQASPSPAQPAPAAGRAKTRGSARAQPAAAASPSGRAASSKAGAARAAPSSGDSNVRDVTAPLLGTFYRAPKPGAPPFVEVGSSVDEESIIGIIEVMKLMNTVRAGVRGRIVEILAHDGMLVEYGEALLRVAPGDPG